MGGRGSSRFITILHRGGLQNLLQYYSFERKMEGYNPFSALNKLKGFHFILFNVDLCLHVLSQIRKNVDKEYKLKRQEICGSKQRHIAPREQD